MAKRKSGDGSFKTLSNNTVEFTVSVGYDLYGNRIRKKFYGKTEAECRKKYKEFIKGGEKTSSSNEYTLSAWLDVWLDTYKKKNVQSSTYEEYVYLAGHIKKHKISGMKLFQIKPLHITDFFADMSDYSHSIRKRLRFLLNGAMESALDNDYILKNPVNRAEIAHKPQKQKEAFTENEVRTILNFAKSDKHFGIQMLIMLNTGIRSGEMRALTLKQIDLENKVIIINRAVKKSGDIGTPKNGKTRYIPIDKDFAFFLSNKLKTDSSYIMGTDYTVSESSFRSRYLCFFKRLNKFLSNVGENIIEPKSPHATRHTFGTLLQKNGMPIAIVSELLGHGSTDVTDKYTHLADINVLKQAVERYRLTS